MELWFTERHTPNVKFSIKVDHQLYSGNKINIDYFVYDIMDRDDVADICDFLADQEKDDIEAAIREFGQDFSENEIRLVRIKFISDMAN